MEKIAKLFKNNSNIKIENDMVYVYNKSFVYGEQGIARFLQIKRGIWEMQWHRNDWDEGDWESGPIYTGLFSEELDTINTDDLIKLISGI